MSPRRTIIRLSAVLAAVALVKGCGDGDRPTAPTTPELARPTTVTVSPATAELTALGETVQLTVEVFDENGHAVAGAEFLWESSDAAVATVDTAGLVTGVAEGMATITASAGEAEGTAEITVMARDRAALIALYETADGPNWVNAENWLTDAPLCDWYGVDTNASGRVVGLDLNGRWDNEAQEWIPHGLKGPIPTELGTLTNLELLWLGRNDLSGPIPTELGTLANLESLDLGGNSLSGPIPTELSSLANLESLDLGGNSLSGPIPTELGTLANLERLSFYRNGLTGPIPTELGTLTNLELLWLGRNDLSGPIPTELGTLANLESLDLGENSLSGPIPTELGTLANLESLDLGGNDLSGPILTELGSLANLEQLALYGNGLTGSIPPELGNLTNFESLDLGGNSLSGPIPTELGSLTNLERLSVYGNGLTGSIPPELGNLANLTSLSLGYNNLSGPIPTELGNLADLRSLNLWGNDLSGPIPRELGSLADLESLDLGYNNLSGPIPQSFLQFDKLRNFYIAGNEGLCVPGTASLVAWLREIENRDESENLCNAADMAVLKLLYETTGGTAWTESDGWLGDGAVEDWYGVTADSLGRVTELDLARNGLAGELPRSLANLAEMTVLRIGGNALSGRLPLRFAGVPLQVFEYADTQLCAPAEASFRAWLDSIPLHESTGVECGPLSERDILAMFYEATGGPDWIHDENWLTDAPLEEWYGVEVNDQGRVVELGFLGNGLTGRIPRELGGLAHLRSLFLYRDGLTGPIPPEFGNLANLRYLSLGENDLTGPIPPELGNLANLGRLSLHENALTGPIPPELGNLANLQWLNLAANRLTGRIPAELGDLGNMGNLYLGRNDLTGPLPSELGNLANLWSLNLAANRLTGRIPAELGGLADLSFLYLGENELVGPVPPEFGGLMHLRRLGLQTNADLSGALPASLTNLTALETFQTGRTDLCAPSDAGFREWLEGVPNRRVALCESEPAMAYLVQAVQSRAFPVPLVAGEDAVLRVFVTAGRDNDERLPPVRASFHLNGALVHVADLPGTPGPIPTEVDEGSLAISGNGIVPAGVVQPGLEMMVEIDPDRTLDAGLGAARRIPETGRTAVEVRDMPLFDLTVIPFLWTTDPDSAILEQTAGMAADPEGHELLRDTRTLLPVASLAVTAHEPVLSSSNSAYALIAETRAIQALEGGSGHYMGTMSGSVTGAGGLAGMGGQESFSIPYSDVIAHEFGHNFSLAHAPCGGAGNPDPAFPYPDGTIGAWGYDFRDGGALVPPSTPDLMSDCGPPDGISDYHFTSALRYRLLDEGAPATEIAASTTSLLLWGGVDADSVPFLEPAFVVNAPAALPDSAGEHRLTGRTASGGELFSLTFAMPEVADGNGSSSFAFVLPVRPEWQGRLASITLSGPDGSVTLDGNTVRPMVILRNPRSGRVRGILRDPLPATQAARDAALSPAPGLEVLFSRGIPDAEAWLR